MPQDLNLSRSIVMPARCILSHLLFWLLALCAQGEQLPSLLIPVPTPTPYEEEELAVIQSLSYYSMLETFNLLSQPKRRRFADLLRNYNPNLSYSEINRSTQIEHYHIPWHILIALGDPVTGTYMAKDVLRLRDSPFAGGWDILTEWRSAQFIKELGSALEVDEPIWIKNDSPSDMNPMEKNERFSVVLAENILIHIYAPYIYKSSKKSTARYFGELPPATRASLKDFYHEWKEAREESGRKARADLNYSYDDALTESYSAIRKTMRAWWIANKVSFLAEKYDEVKPLDEATTILPPNAPRKRHSNPATPAPTSVSTPIASTPESAQKPSGNYAIFGTVAALLAAIIIFFRRRSLGKK